MRPRLDAFDVGWLLLHLLQVAWVCAHEAFWLLGKQLTIAPESSSHLRERLEHVSAILIGSNSSSRIMSRNIIAPYLHSQRAPPRRIPMAHVMLLPDGVRRSMVMAAVIARPRFAISSNHAESNSTD